MARADKVLLFESRVARLLTSEGAFVRRRVPLEPYFGQRFAVTDLDVWAIEFNGALQATVSVIECKTTEARSAASGADRALWLAGLMRLARAERSGLYMTKSAGDPLRRLALELGSTVSDERDVERRERVQGLEASGRYGTHDPSLLALPDHVRAATKADAELHRAYWFARSDLWLSAPVPALKRALGAARVVGERYSDRLPPAEVTALRWLASELVVGIVLAVARLAGESYRQPEAIFSARLGERLAEGLADHRALEQLSKAIDEYMAGVLRQAGVAPGPLVQALGAFAPRPPAYAERLTELVHRFAGSPAAAGAAARRADERFADAFLARTASAPAGAGDEEADRLIRLVASFVGRSSRLPDELLAPLHDGPEAAAWPLPDGWDLAARADRGDERAAGRAAASVSEPRDAEAPGESTLFGDA